ncbi:hypothetical protein JTB14_010969 [Gonioctena quinquepunctata]|nr:hypothetical protein JTB14_010969 [Gonioctena quinquepunctata]
MVHDTSYDARISTIGRIETRKEVPSRREGGGEAMKNHFEAGIHYRNERRGGRNTLSSPRDNEATRFPYMRTRCLRCSEEGHRVVGCGIPKKLFFHH